MPTSRNVTPLHALPLILAIPLLLLLVAIPPVAVDADLVPISLRPGPLAFHKPPAPVPWEDGEYTDGIPPGSAGDDLSRRKIRSSRTNLRDEHPGRSLPLRSGAVGPRLVLIESLLDAFLIGLPPPTAASAG